MGLRHATGATEIEKIKPVVTEMYLAHAERGMKSHYAERDWAALDEALVELEKRINLSAEEAAASTPAAAQPVASAA